MSQYKNRWLHREQGFAAFVVGPLAEFWHNRQEDEFIGVDGLAIRFVRFSAVHHDSVIVICPGRIESYVKYAELAYDLYHSGYDILIIDHRGQGRSGRMLSDRHRGHVNRFGDYVDDLDAFWHQHVACGPWQQRFILAHSMGGAIVTLFLQRHPRACDAVALCAPMFGIYFRLPEWMVRHLLNWTESSPLLRNGYALGTGRWRAVAFNLNQLTHSRARYRRNVSFYADEPALRVGGPTYHWVHESVMAGEQVMAGASQMTVPTLLIQAGEDRVVDNEAQNVFSARRAAAGFPLDGGRPLVIDGAFHEILFECDAMRHQALEAIVRFFASHRGTRKPVSTNKKR